MRASILIPAGVALAVIWITVGVVLHVTEPYVVTPEKILALVQQAPWKGGKKPGQAERKAFLEKVVDQINRLDLEQARRMRDDGQAATEDFFMDLTDAEQKWFVAQTVEKQFRFVMKSFDAMPLDERRKRINGVRNNMRKNGRSLEALDGLAEADPKVFENIAEQGMCGYYDRADDKRKRLLGPVLAELQGRVGR